MGLLPWRPIQASSTPGTWVTSDRNHCARTMFESEVLAGRQILSAAERVARFECP
jgi:hypothetical protein